MGIVINSGTILRGSTVRSSYPGDNYLPYTTLLLNGNGANNANNNVFLDGSTNNFAITRNGNATQGTFSPFSKSGWSNYFDGNTDYLTVPANSGFDYGTSDFTIEGWFYFNSVSSSSIIAGTWAVSPNRGWFLYFDTTLGITFTFSTTGSNAIDASSSYTPSANTWNHIAVSRTGVNLYFFVNGVQRGSTYNISTSSIYANSQTLYIGNRGSQLDAFYYTGYISNFRIVKGTAVYTSAFNPPTAPLTAISGTSLLTCQSNRFIDTNTQAAAKTITKNGDTSVVAFSPFASTDDWNASVHSGSGYFDGTGDYLTLATGIPVPSTGTFTIEAWVYLTDTTEEAIWTQYSAGTAGRSSFRVSSGKLIFANAAASTVTTTASVPTNAWTHVAAVRDSSNNLMLFINGNLDVTSVSYTASIQQIAATIGSFSDTTSALSGYISNLRITNTAAYTSTFTPPTAPLTAIANTSLLLNFTNAGVYDATGKNNLETVGDAKISTAQSKWGGSSMYFDGTGDWLLSTPSVINDFGTGNFTIEAWIYMTSTSNYFYIYNSSNVNFNSPNFTFLYDVSLGLRMYAHAGTYTVDQGSTSGWVANTWYYVTLVRNGGTITLYRNGTSLVSGSTFSGVSFGSATAFLQIGGSSPDVPSRSNNGNIQDLRVTKGIARYTANFTPPERQLLGKA